MTPAFWGRLEPLVSLCYATPEGATLPNGWFPWRIMRGIHGMLLFAKTKIRF